jgi:hypothetical protein
MLQAAHGALIATNEQLRHELQAVHERYAADSARWQVDGEGGGAAAGSGLLLRQPAHVHRAHIIVSARRGVHPHVRLLRRNAGRWLSVWVAVARMRTPLARVHAE